MPALPCHDCQAAGAAQPLPCIRSRRGRVLVPGRALAPRTTRVSPGIRTRFPHSQLHIERAHLHISPSRAAAAGAGGADRHRYTASIRPSSIRAGSQPVAAGSPAASPRGGPVHGPALANCIERSPRDHRRAANHLGRTCSRDVGGDGAYRVDLSTASRTRRWKRRTLARPPVALSVAAAPVLVLSDHVCENSRMSR